MPYRILRLLILCLFAATVVHAQEIPNLVVAWVENGDVWVWRAATGESIKYTNGKVQNLFLSPDGQYIAFTTIPVSSVWLITPNSPTPVEVVPNSALAESEPESVNIHNVSWGKNNRLYFSTYLQSPTASTRLLDLWSVDAASLTYKQLTSLGEAGIFTLSPDGTYIAIVNPGAYEKTEGTIRMLDLSSLEERNHFAYEAVSSASNVDFIPRVYWMSDNLSLRAAIPDKDLVYADDTALTTLWQLGVDGTKKQISTLQASFFNLPQWSSDGEYLTYMRHVGSINDNQYELMVADGDGSNSLVYITGSAGTHGQPQWIPDSHRFYFAQGEAGEYWVGEPEQPTQRLAQYGVAIKFINSSTYVSGGLSNQLFGMFYGILGNPNSTIIAPVETSYLTFDGVVLP